MELQRMHRESQAKAQHGLKSCSSARNCSSQQIYCHKQCSHPQHVFFPVTLQTANYNAGYRRRVAKCQAMLSMRCCVCTTNDLLISCNWLFMQREVREVEGIIRIREDGFEKAVHPENLRQVKHCITWQYHIVKHSLLDPGLLQHIETDFEHLRLHRGSIKLVGEVGTIRHVLSRVRSKRAQAKDGPYGEFWTARCPMVSYVALIGL